MFALPAAVIPRLHAGAQDVMLSHHDHEVVEGNATQVAGQPAAAGCAPAHLHQLPGGELSQDLIGKLHGDQLRFRHLGGGVLLSVQQHPQHPQCIVCFPCDKHIPASPFLVIYPFYQS